jgi:hypothetical protein
MFSATVMGKPSKYTLLRDNETKISARDIDNEIENTTQFGK